MISEGNRTNLQQECAYHQLELLPLQTTSEQGDQQSPVLGNTELISVIFTFFLKDWVTVNLPFQAKQNPSPCYSPVMGMQVQELNKLQDNWTHMLVFA